VVAHQTRLGNLAACGSYSLGQMLKPSRITWNGEP
jgi:hypothetical protein